MILTKMRRTYRSCTHRSKNLLSMLSCDLSRKMLRKRKSYNENIFVSLIKTHSFTISRGMLHRQAEPSHTVVLSQMPSNKFNLTVILSVSNLMTDKITDENIYC